MEKHPPGPDPSHHERDLPPRLQEMGISYAQSHRYQAMARLPEPRAERRAGELLRDMEKDKGGNPNLLDDQTGSPPTLEELGISRFQSHRYQAIAHLPEPDSEAHVDRYAIIPVCG